MLWRSVGMGLSLIPAALGLALAAVGLLLYRAGWPLAGPLLTLGGTLLALALYSMSAGRKWLRPGAGSLVYPPRALALVAPAIGAVLAGGVLLAGAAALCVLLGRRFTLPWPPPR